MHEKLNKSIAELRGHTVAPLVGIREIFYGYEEFPHSPNYLTRDDVKRGLRILEKEGVPYDFFVIGGWKSFPVQFVPDMAEEFPELKINIHHIACPEISKSERRQSVHLKGGHILMLNLIAEKPGFKAWADAMSAAAAHPNVYCKISDLLSVDDNRTATGERGWKLETVKPYTDHVISAFGTDRCMYGSNWPVCTIPRSEHGDTAEYDDAIADFKKVVAEFSPMEQQAMAAGNAKRFYGLKDL